MNFKLILFHGVSSSLGDNRLSQKDDSLLGSNTSSLDHDEIVVNDTIMRESSHRSDILLSKIIEGRSIVFNSINGSFSHSVDLLVEFSSVMETEITSSGDSPSYSSWMPRSDTSDSSVTSMGFLGKMLDSVSLDNTLGSFSLGDSHDIHVLILLENTVDGDFLFEQSSGEINLLGYISSIDLDFHDVVLLLSKVQFVHLGGSNHSDNSGVLSNSVKFHIDGFVLFVLMFLRVFGESFLLAAHPILIESSKSVLI